MSIGTANPIYYHKKNMTHPKGHVRRPVITFIVTAVLTTVVILWKLLHDLNVPRP